MPVRDHPPPPPQKKRKVEASSKEHYKYASGSEIRRVFKAQSERGLIEGTRPAYVMEWAGLLTDIPWLGLTALRNQLTIKPHEYSVKVNDERLLLAKSWLDEDPGAQELFAAWEAANLVRLISVYDQGPGLIASLETNVIAVCDCWGPISTSQPPVLSLHLPHLRATNTPCPPFPRMDSSSQSLPRRTTHRSRTRDFEVVQQHVQFCRRP